MVALPLLLTLLCYPAFTYTLVYSNHTFTFSSEYCFSGQTLLVYEDRRNEAQQVCNDVTQVQLDTICSKIDRCSNSAGVITGSTNPTTIPLIFDQYSVEFNTNYDCSLEVLCYNPQESCVLPDLLFGSFEYENGTRYPHGLLNEGESVAVSCDTGYAWHWADFVSCIKMSTGEAQLSRVAECVPLPVDYKMKLEVNASSLQDISQLTGLPQNMFSLTNTNSIFSSDERLEELECYSNSTHCYIPVHYIDISGTSDLVNLIDGTYSSLCFETAITSLFLMGLQKSPDLLANYDTRPKREITTQLLNARLDSMEMSFNRKDQTRTGIKVHFYLFHYKDVVSPAVVTKVMSLVPRDQYDLVLENYCRLALCDNPDPNSADCQTIPAMQFNSYPSPVSPCIFQGVELKYGEAVPLQCEKNEYIAEDKLTKCLFSDVYSPSELPTCQSCGGVVDSQYARLTGPSKGDGTLARGADCTWRVDAPHRNLGQFWQTTKDDDWTCNNPVDYLSVVQYNGTKNTTNNNICYGTYMRLSERFDVRYVSSSASETSKSFNFFFDADLPPEPWYKRYLAILVAAPTIVIFFSSLVLLGVYCDNRNKEGSTVKEIKVDVEHGDQISNGTWKSTELKKPPVEEEDSAISPQPRIHNAVTGPGERKKKKKKKRVSVEKTPDSEEADMNGPGYGSWVGSGGWVAENCAAQQQDVPQAEEKNTLREAEEEEDEEREESSNEVFHSPPDRGPLTARSGEQAQGAPSAEPPPGYTLPTKPRKKKRKKKRSSPPLSTSERPLPTLREMADAPARKLPPLTDTPPAPAGLLANNGAIHIPGELGVD